MSLDRRYLCLALLLATSLPAPALAQALREVHGAHDAWAEPGLALAWAVLRGRDETRTRVVVRVEADAQRHASLRASGRDPFGGGSIDLPVQRDADGAWRIDLPRSHFADYPRTELRFQAPGQSTPDLLVYYQGVPDTTPESSTASQLDESLRARLAGARAALR